MRVQRRHPVSLLLGTRPLAYPSSVAKVSKMPKRFAREGLTFDLATDRRLLTLLAVYEYEERGIPTISVALKTKKLSVVMEGKDPQLTQELLAEAPATSAFPARAIKRYEDAAHRTETSSR